MTQKHSKKQFHFKHVSHSINKIEIKLDEADKQASMTSKRLSHQSIFNHVRNTINRK
ncbi:hypothetical protein PP722_23665 [Lysinibacillus sphaericus]|nr:hypothetical protein [Lysinibacillus sphaericus]